MKIADEIWVATALLHYENPSRRDFTVAEIVGRALAENPEAGFRPGLPIHASNHCVATKSPNPARHRMLAETARGRRRLFRDGDAFHPYRTGGKVCPDRQELPENYVHLLDWYEGIYVRKLSA